MYIQETKSVCQPQDDSWKKYLQMIHSSVRTQIKKIIIKNLQYLYDELTLNKGWFVVDIAINLQQQKFEIQPQSIQNQMAQLQDSIYQLTKIYYNPLYDDDYNNLLLDEDVQKQQKQIKDYLDQLQIKVENLYSLIQNYQFLVNLDVQQFLNDFVNYCGNIKSGVTSIQKTENSTQAQVDDFITQIDFIDQLSIGLANEIPQEIEIDCLHINMNAIVQQLQQLLAYWKQQLIFYLQQYADQKCQELSDMTKEAQTKLQQNYISPEEFYDIKQVLIHVNKIAETFDQEKEKLKQIALALQRLGQGEYKIQYIDQIIKDVDNVIEQSKDTNQIIQPVEKQVYDDYTTQENDLCLNIQTLSDQWLIKQENEFIVENLSNIVFSDMTKYYNIIDQTNMQCNYYQEQINKLMGLQQYFTIFIHSSFKLQQVEQQIKQIKKQLIEFKQLVDLNTILNSIFNYYLQQKYDQLDIQQLQTYLTQIQRQVIHLAHNYQIYKNITQSISIVNSYIPLIQNIQHPALRDRHRHQIVNCCKINVYVKPCLKLSQLIQYQLNQYNDDISQIVNQSQKELNQETILSQLNQTFTSLKLEFQDIYFIIPTQTTKEIENMQQQIQQLAGSPLQTFKSEIQIFQDKLIFIEQVLNIWTENQLKIKNLAPLILQSREVQAKLPETAEQFKYVYNIWKENIQEAQYHQYLYELAIWNQQMQIQEDINTQLSIIEKQIQQYLDTKRSAFPRFSFISSNDLLEILANQNNPKAIENQISKLFEDIKEINIQNDKIDGITSKDGEILNFQTPIDFQCEAEIWLKQLQTEIKKSLVDLLTKSVQQIGKISHKEWILNTNAQIANLTIQINFTNLVEGAFQRFSQSEINPLISVQNIINEMIQTFVNILQREIPEQLNKKLIGICTILINQKDIVQNLIDNQVNNNRDFKWISNLRYVFSPENNEILIRICDTTFKYGFEPIGIPSWLVVTKLTSKCYITISQALQLHYFTSAQGPAGTGKTETTKDLAKKLGKMCFVYNCSPEMTGSSIQQILKGAEESKAWLCFDEFNRISAEVLSVVATYVKQMLEKQRKVQKQYISEAAVIITMNPGYAGRTELPDNLKALFRSVSMVVPDFAQITEIMLASNGFVNSRELAKKFVKLYDLNKELLSKQDHYDWGLRAIIAICRQAGALRRKQITQKQDE